MSQEVFSPELESLPIVCVEDGCDPLQSRRMDELICTDRAARAAYVNMMGMHAILQ